MKFESKEEQDAFEFICACASDACSRNGCNDLSGEDLQKFGHLSVKRGEFVEGTLTQFDAKVVYDFDVVAWLKARVERRDD